MKSIIATAASFLLMVSSSFGQTNPDAKINLILESPETTVSVGETFEVPILMAAATEPQRYIVSDIIFGWDQTKLEFLGISHVGSHPNIWVPPSGMPCPAGYQNCAGIGTDYTQINEAIPPADGNGLYYGYGALGYVFIVNQQPIQIVRLQFKVLESFVQTEVKVLPEYNTVIENKTVIYGSNIPGLSVLGTITDAVIFGTPAPAGDFNGDGVVGSEDMAALLGNWGALSFKNNPYDLDGDGVVGAGDLAILVSNWS